MSKSLSLLVSEQNALIEALVANEGEITPEMESLLKHLEFSIPEKVDGYYLILERFDFEADYFRTRAEEFIKAAKVIQSAKERLKEHLKATMEFQKLSELAGNDFKFTLSNSKPKVVIQEELVPKEYTREVVETKIDKDRIAEDLKIGVPVPGCRLEPVFALRQSVNKKILSKKSVS